MPWRFQARADTEIYLQEPKMEQVLRTSFTGFLDVAPARVTTDVSAAVMVNVTARRRTARTMRHQGS